MQKNQDTETARAILNELGVDSDASTFLSIGTDDRMYVEVPIDAITNERNLESYDYNRNGNMISICIENFVGKSTKKMKKSLDGIKALFEQFTDDDIDSINQAIRDSGGISDFGDLSTVLFGMTNKSAKKMKKSLTDVPAQFYVNLNGGQVLTFVKEDYPMGVRWLCSDDCRFYSDDGSTEIFPCMQIPDDGRTLFLFEEKGWANDYDAEYSDATGYDAINGFEDYINDVLASGVFIDYGDEDIMESTKKMNKSDDMPNSYAVRNSPVIEGRNAIFTLKHKSAGDGGVIYWYASPDNDEDYIKHDMVDGTYTIHQFMSDLAYSSHYGNNLMDVLREWYQTDDIELNPMSSSEEAEDRMYYASAKKSIPSIHDMIAQTRANNNSLVKSRVNLK